MVVLFMQKRKQKASKKKFSGWRLVRITWLLQKITLDYKSDRTFLIPSHYSQFTRIGTYTLFSSSPFRDTAHISILHAHKKTRSSNTQAMTQWAKSGKIVEWILFVRLVAWFPERSKSTIFWKNSAGNFGNIGKIFNKCRI